MIEPKIDDLLAAVDSKYSLGTLAAKRAREINSPPNPPGRGRGAGGPLVGRRWPRCIQCGCTPDRSRQEDSGRLERVGPVPVAMVS